MRERTKRTYAPDALQQAQDLMMNAPCNVSADQLKELSIRVRKPSN